MSFLFPDISEWNPNADIAGILKKSGGHLVIRAGYGPSRKDFKFDDFRKRASGAKTLGIYHFVTKGGSVKANADAMIKWVGKTKANEYLVLDVEQGSGDWTKSQCEDYMNRVRKACGGKVLIYANEHYAATGGRKPLFTSKTGWVAKYSSTKPSVPHLIWQSAGTINNKGVGSNITNWPGVGSNGDTNIVTVSEKTFMDAVLSGGGSTNSSGGGDVPNFVWYAKSKSQALKKNEWTTVNFDNMGPGSKKGDYWSVVFGEKSYSLTFSVVLSGLSDNAEVQMRAVQYRLKGGINIGTLPGNNLKKGSKGPAVKTVQQALVKLGEKLPKYGADSDYGDETVAAVKSFQGKNGLTKDGEYGPKTKAKMEAKASANASWERLATHPLDSPVHKSGNGHFIYNLVERIGSGDRLRVEVSQYGTSDARIESAKVTTLQW